MITRGALPAVVLFALAAGGTLAGLITTATLKITAFRLRSLQGAWGYSASGTVGGFMSAAAGRLVFDGTGGCIPLDPANTTIASGVAKRQ